MHASPNSYPLFSFRVPAGFPSPAADYTDEPLNLHDYLVPRPAATLFHRVQDEAMNGASITIGDLLIVDRSLKPTHGRLVLVRMDGETLVRRLQLLGRVGKLVAANPKYAEIDLKEGVDHRILGVVRYRIHSFI
jgi:DNA polymerase V